MTEYIKKEDALFAFYRLYVFPKSDDSEKYMQQIEDIHNDIKNLPAADVVEQKHGKWIEQEDPWFGWGVWQCSNCKEEYVLEEGTPDDNFYNYCPNCGAIMDGDS